MNSTDQDIGTILRTTGAARRFTDRPVDDATLDAILDDARFAPSGGNRQPWRVAVVRDPALRRQLADLMWPVWDVYNAIGATGRTPFNPVDGLPSHDPQVREAATDPPRVEYELLDNPEQIPAMLAIAADLRALAMMDAELDRPALVGGGSVFPFCWSLLLSARRHGLGGVLTTFLARAESEAAPLLGLPADHALAATVFIGYPERFPTKLTRKPVAEFATIDRFDGAPFGRGA